MTRLQWMATLNWVAVLLTLGMGCSSGERLNPVRGKVLLQGQPLAGALVSFHPQDAQGDPPTGFTGPDGAFSVVTGNIEGARAGTYRVTIMCQVPTNKKPEGLSFGGVPETEDRLKGAYANVATSQITVTVKEGQNELEPFDLK
jgi:hypothetical protein